MKVGLFVDLRGASQPVDLVRGAASAAAANRLHSLWLQNGMGYDAGVMATVASLAAPQLEVGIGVIPAPTRHPLAVAQLAVTLQQVTGGRFTIGIGASHPDILANVFRISVNHPVRAMREHLDVLEPALRGQGPLEVVPSRAPAVLLGALQPGMLELAGSRTDGTVTWLTGERTLRTHIVPRISEAAARADRPKPRVVAMLPVCVTTSVEAVRQRVNARLRRTSELPSYAAMMALERAAEPADMAVYGTEAEVHEGLLRLADAGVTELAAMVLATGSTEWERTLGVLGCG